MKKIIIILIVLLFFVGCKDPKDVGSGVITDKERITRNNATSYHFYVKVNGEVIDCDVESDCYIRKTVGQNLFPRRTYTICSTGKKNAK
jgi:hypothetical protein